MKIQILSDLHNEFLRNGKKNPTRKWSAVIPETDADIIILAGDIDTGTKGAEWAILESERLGKPILYVLGNYEFYGHDDLALLRLYSDAGPLLGKVVDIESMCVGDRFALGNSSMRCPTFGTPNRCIHAVEPNLRVFGRCRQT